MLIGDGRIGKRLCVCLTVWALGAVCAWASADVVTLKSGRTLRGKVIERREAEIVLQVDYGQITIQRADIASILEESDLDRVLGEATALAAGGQYERAIERYRQVLAGKADAAGVREKVINCYRDWAKRAIEGRDVAGAERAIQAWLDFAPADDEAKRSLATLGALKARVAEFVERAGLLFDIGAYADAAQEYMRVMTLSPERVKDLKPLLAEAYEETGNANFVQQRYPEAALSFQQALRLSVDAAGSRPAETDARLREMRKRWAYAMMVPVINQINSGRTKDPGAWETAAETAERVAQDAPGVAQPYFILGLCREALGDPSGAMAAYAKVTGVAEVAGATPGEAKAARDKANELVRQDPVRVVVATKDLRWLQVEPGDWRTLTTDHFVIFHHNEYVARKVARAAEYWMNALIVHWTAPGTYTPWRRKCDIYIYPTREAFQRATQQPDWVPAVSYVLSRDGQLVDHRVSTYQNVRLLNEAVLPHELTHVIFPQFLGYPQIALAARPPAAATQAGPPTGTQPADSIRALPRWIHECTALLEEPDYKRYRFREAVKTYLADGVALTAKEIMAVGDNPSDDKAQRYYAECHAMAEYLMTKGGRTKLLAFAKATLKDGDEKALLATYGFKSLAEFEQAWRAYVLAQK